MSELWGYGILFILLILVLGVLRKMFEGRVWSSLTTLGLRVFKLILKELTTIPGLISLSLLVGLVYSRTEPTYLRQIVSVLTPPSERPGIQLFEFQDIIRTIWTGIIVVFLANLFILDRVFPPK